MLYHKTPAKKSLHFKFKEKSWKLLIEKANSYFVKTRNNIKEQNSINWKIEIEFLPIIHWD